MIFLQFVASFKSIRRQPVSFGKLCDRLDCDVAIIGAGIGGLTAGAILSSRYGFKVNVYESHYRAGGCAHSFDIKSKAGTTYKFDAGPTIILGASNHKQVTNIGVVTNKASC